MNNTFWNLESDDYMDQTVLIQSAQCGDLDAFNQLVLTFQDRLFNIAVGMLRDEALAADAVQNAFINAFRNLNYYRGGSFASWLFRILKNACYDELRWKKRHFTLPLEPVSDDGEEFVSPMGLRDASQDPTSMAEDAELTRAIQRGLQTLSPEYRLALTLVDIDGLGYAEAAAVARVPIGTIRSRLARARLQLCWELRLHTDLLPDVYTRAKAQTNPRNTVTFV
jgi:RNA polymerase sigma-70 factor, ECF subfamily